mmetsp:Transcript_7093/g.17799  ORF Transcript_7093/g.17799 Transcript_7093/m.17799 type:complete len:208 (+) Transcript_7093:1641-2264(+)
MAVLGPTRRLSRFAQTMAMRYAGIGTFCSNRCNFQSLPQPSGVSHSGSAQGSGPAVLTADMRALRSAGQRMHALYVALHSQVSWHGSMARAWIAWHCENMYGNFFPAVCAGESHCKAEQPPSPVSPGAAVSKKTRTITLSFGLPAGNCTRSAKPRTSLFLASSRLHWEAFSTAPSTCTSEIWRFTDASKTNSQFSPSAGASLLRTQW